MKEGRGFHFAVAVLGLGVGVANGQTPLGTAFTYQGHLEQNGSPVDDTCDFEFSLWDDSNDPNPGNQVGDTLIFDGVDPNPAPIAVSDGMLAAAVSPSLLCLVFG